MVCNLEVQKSPFIKGRCVNVAESKVGVELVVVLDY